jgi:hypothetical protein
MEFNRASFNGLPYNFSDGICFLASSSSFQVCGKLNKGILLIVAKWCGGIRRLLAFLRTLAGFASLLNGHKSWKDSGRFNKNIHKKTFYDSWPLTSRKTKNQMHKLSLSEPTAANIRRYKQY